jgi:threonine dehydratase
MTCDVTLAMVEEAKALLAAELPPTPTFFSPSLSRLAGVPVYVKYEIFQPIRAFKVRGALAHLLHRARQGIRDRAVVAASAGNHGLAVAYAARRLGLRAAIYVPKDANAAKVAAIRWEGAEVVATGSDFQEALQAALAEHPQAAFVHPFDDPWVIAGQGTLALEALSQASFDTVFLAVGGGGLLGGAGLAFKEHEPQMRVVGVEMRGADSLARSLAAGRLVALERVSTIADGLAPRSVSERTLTLARRYMDELVLLDDADLWRAMRLCLSEERVLTEPSGAASLAGLLARPDLVGRAALVVLSGGNATPQQLSTLLSLRL